MSNKSKNIIKNIVKKDYNDVLEEVLSTKTYDENVKNLLLDILYKLDDSYQDYAKVKVNALSKEEYMQNIINTIKNKCDSIICVKSEDEQKFIVNKAKKQIVCYPILTKLLYAISQIRKSENICKDEDELINKTVTEMINTGNNINTVEPLRDFNGFSWNVIVKDMGNLYYNLIYQNLIILNGNKFLEQWTNVNKTNINYMEELQNQLQTKYGTKESKEIIELLKNISVWLKINANIGIVKDMYDEKIDIEEELDKLEQSVEYLSEITEKKRALIKKIRRIDITLNSEELLEKEYHRRNNMLKDSEKIFSVKVLSKKLQNERTLILKQITEYNDMINPKNIIGRQDKLQKKLKYRRLVDVKSIDDEIYRNIVLLQKIVFKCLRIRMKACTSKEELIKIMYQLRYLNMLPIDEKRMVKDIPELSKSIYLTKKLFFLKANELKIVNQISYEDELNMAIYSHLFSTKIISLEDISLKLIKNKNEWYVQFFDEGVTDEVFKVEANLNNEDIKIRPNKKTKLFNI